MILNRRVRSLASLTVAGAYATVAFGSITIDTVPVGNIGNAADSRVMSDGTSGYGSVAYAYRVGTTEVTNAQYAAFLNAVAATDANTLYNPSMGGAVGGIARSGASGSYVYSTINGRENHPVNYVSFWDAARFANWLHNGQPTGAQSNATTEDGAYTLTPGGISANTVTRNTGWQWAVTSEDEWYKAAYYQPVSQGGDPSNYWLHAISSNVVTTADANFSGVIGDTVPAGAYAANFYGAFDMSGNSWEWNESIIGSSRGFRGGTFDLNDFYMRADYRNDGPGGPGAEAHGLGFRVTQIPGTSSVALLALGGLGAARRRSRD